MKQMGMVVLGIPLATAIAFGAMGFYSKTGQAAGLVNGHLSPCPSSPNCVSSESAPNDSHAIAALQVKGSHAEETLAKVGKAITALGGQVHTTQADYLAATFTSKVFGFVDDVEVQVDSNSGVVHIRSASRVGYSDFGANRARVEKIRALLSAQP